MTAKELIAALKLIPPSAEVMVEVELDECDVCAGLKHEKCSHAGKMKQFISPPYYFEAGDEVVITLY